MKSELRRAATAAAFAVLFGGALAVGAAIEPPTTRQAATPPAVKADEIDLAPVDAIDESCWSTLRTKRVYFAHQAVGSGIVLGLREIMRTHPAANLEIVAYAEPDSSDGTTHTSFDAPAVVEGVAGRRGNPERKIDEFVRFLRSSEGAKVDIAMLKLCYGDIGRMTDTEELFSKYVKAVEELRTERPNIHIIHCTVPLKAEEHGAKARMKRWVGAGSASSNAARERFNDAIRTRFPAEQILDIAKAESHRPDGARTTVEHDDKAVPVLCDEYTDDGANLNRKGQLVLAREFLVTLSRQCGQRPAATVGSAGAEEHGDR